MFEFQHSRERPCPSEREKIFIIENLLAHRKMLAEIVSSAIS
jgi:hypothetical protein